MKCFMLINVKMRTIVGILTFIGMINTISESLKARKNNIFQHYIFYIVGILTFIGMINTISESNIFHHFIFYEQLKFHTPLS